MIQRFSIDAILHTEEESPWAEVYKYVTHDGDYVLWEDHERHMQQMQEQIDTLQEELDSSMRGAC